MPLFKCNIDRDMINTGSAVKPFLSARVEVREYYIGRLRYCTVTIEKTMDNIGTQDRPWHVKTYEHIQARLFGIAIRNKEQSWKFNKL
jgi:hypothetical protein